MDAHLIESIISLFNSGVLVHYVRTPRTEFNPCNLTLTVDAANGVRFEGREKIIKLEEENQKLKDLILEACEILCHVDYLSDQACDAAFYIDKKEVKKILEMRRSNTGEKRINRIITKN